MSALQSLETAPTKRAEPRPRSRREAIRFALGTCALGELLVAATTGGICAIQLGDNRNALIEELEARFPLDRCEAGSEVKARIGLVVRAIEQPGADLDLPLAPRGTAFQRTVWRALRAIPRGSTVTYGELATRIGQPDAARAVARACGANPLAVLVPCHRVVRADGGLGGYRWGVECKAALLRREGAR
jgi:AraC family transcriptional regulator of adaptative response/methylated-DNA-[protein]-cysteine methyltransferase